LQESEKDEIVSFHNHPLGMPPSDGDLNAALKNGYQKGYTIGHDGTVFEYTAPKEFIPLSVYDAGRTKYTKKGCSEFEAQLNTLLELKELFQFDFKEVKSSG
jgi:hypothetical protein